MRQAFEIEGLADPALINVLAVRDQILALADDNGLEAIAFQTFMSVVDAMGAYCIFAEGEVAEHHAFALESDVHGAITGALLRRATFGHDPVWLAEFAVRHPTDDNAAMLWHAGAPLSLRHPDAQVKIGHHWILPSPLSGMTHFRLKDGPITVARFDGEVGDYRLAVGEGHSTDGPPTQNNYVWMAVDNWPHWERALIEGPFPHHLAMAYGHYAAALVEACRFVPGTAAREAQHMSQRPSPRGGGPGRENAYGYEVEVPSWSAGLGRGQPVLSAASGSRLWASS